MLALCQASKRPFDRQRKHRGIERLDDGAEDRAVEKILTNDHGIGADRRAPSLVVQAGVVMDDNPLPRRLAVPADLGADRAAAGGATGKPREQVGGLVLIARAAHEFLAVLSAGENRRALFEPRRHALCEVFGDDP